MNRYRLLEIQELLRGRLLPSTEAVVMELLRECEQQMTLIDLLPKDAAGKPVPLDEERTPQTDGMWYVNCGSVLWTYIPHASGKSVSECFIDRADAIASLANAHSKEK
jgi:hypothetical protein